MAVERRSLTASGRTTRCAELRGHARGPRRPASLRAQDEPAKGAGRRASTSERAAERLRSLDHQLLAYVGADGYPEVVPLQIGGADHEGHAASPLSAGSGPGVAGRACLRTRYRPVS